MKAAAGSATSPVSRRGAFQTDLADASVIVAVVPVDVTRTREILQFGRGHLDRVAMSIDPVRNPTLPDIANGVLDGFGKDSDLALSYRAGDVAIRQATAWLSACPPTDLAILDAARLSRAVVHDVVAWLVGLGVRPWIVILDDPDLPAARTWAIVDELQDRWSATTVSSPAVDRYWRTPSMQGPAASPSQITATFPAVPHVDLPLFRQYCRELLDPTDFRIVDERLVGYHLDFLDEFATCAGTKAHGLVCGILRKRLESIADVNEGVVAVRAAQAAALKLGWLMTVDTLRLLAGLHSIPRLGKAVSEGWWDLLLAYRDPNIGAIAACYLHDIDLPAMTALTLADITRTATGVSIRCYADERISIDGAAATFIMAVEQLRLVSGASPQDALFRNHRSDNATVRHLGHMLHVPMAEIGVAPGTVPVRLTRYTNSLWLDRFGISVAKIDRAPRAKK